jgi:dynein heavy chain, axonemal
MEAVTETKDWHKLMCLCLHLVQIPYSALRYVTGECNYGGRVTDDKDRLLLNTLLETCYCPDVVSQLRHKLSPSGTYLRFIEELPAIPSPEAFGLHENADITKDQNDTALMFTSLLSMSGGSGGSSTGMYVSLHACCAC